MHQRGNYLGNRSDDSDLEELPHLIEVTNSLWRGGQPTHTGLRQLKSRGIRTIINLREEHLSISQEAALAKELSLEYISLPLRPFDVPSQDSIERFLAVVENDRYHPVFVHCLHGMDRTGLMVALYRLKVQDWSFEPAYEEMLQLGFHEAFVNLRSVVIESAIAWGKLPMDFPPSSR
ncbi:MAG: tyrosine-protein phosphatase [Cyanobacteria bacterium]|nr:tyrosine-protein phosphatase [Cyanobacteriota bacterium]